MSRGSYVSTVLHLGVWCVASAQLSYIETYTFVMHFLNGYQLCLGDICLKFWTF